MPKVTIQQLFNAIPAESIQLMVANSALLSADRGSKKKPPHIKIGVPDEIVTDAFKHPKEQSALLLITVDRDAWEAAIKKLEL
jgi:hypothetical protein